MLALKSPQGPLLVFHFKTNGSLKNRDQHIWFYSRANKDSIRILDDKGILRFLEKMKQISLNAQQRAKKDIVIESLYCCYNSVKLIPEA